MLTAEAIRQRARELGFDLCGVAPAIGFPELTWLQEWLARGYAGEMDYLEKSADVRADIRRFLPSARSVIVMGTVYNTEQESGTRDQGSGSDAIRVARYARGQDYHKVIEDRLIELIDWMQEESPEPFDAAQFVDKHQVQERVFAHHAGIGWVGKNCCVINPGLGSWLFLSGIATSLVLEPDAPAVDRCGSCTLCIDACPTGALVDARQLDATKCISYLTIETNAGIPEPQRPLLEQHAWGCDICQAVCPWNLGAAVTADPAWHGPLRHGLSAAGLWERSDDELHEVIKGSAMTYVPLSRLRRNLAVIIGNSGNASLAGVLDRPGRGRKNAARSTLTPAVQDAVAWARQQLAGE
ncbi:MAG: tRNA epoxyqueuosine(34) reductase QueG [Acidimicrobiia bacterium]|nr:tRNA epoxyqueuosine(34) reductase QueG [Acidimicrobiia bacterium]